MFHVPARKSPSARKCKTAIPAWPALVGASLLICAVHGTAMAGTRAHRPAAAQLATPLPQAEAMPLIAVVSIGDQHVTIWSGDTIVARAPVSTGMDGHRTPLGVFSVIGKERYHESNIYSGAPMPFMQRITWSGVAMHAGVLPGYAASHGCIRMPDGFAQRLYGMTHVGMRVIVASHDISPTMLADTALPAPTFVRAAALTSLLPAEDQALQSADATGAGTLLGATRGRMLLGGPVDATGRLLNPMERGKLEQGRAKDLALEAKADAEALLEMSQARSAEADAAIEAGRRAEDDVLATGRGLEKARQQEADAMIEGAAHARAGAMRAALEVAYAGAVQKRAAAQRAADASDQAAFRAAADANAAIAERDSLEQAARVARHATEPISVFVSRKEHRVFVRQGFEPVFDADVDIADPDAPLGTHVFTAVAAPTDGGAMRWVALTVPGSGPAPHRVLAKGHLIKAAMISEPSSKSLPPTAANALARITFSDAVMQKISEKLWTGASLIISDYGISDETGAGTDFVVLTH